MTFDHTCHELTGWLNGVAGDRWLDDPRADSLIASAYNAYMQGHCARVPGTQAGEDAGCPKDQYYSPPDLRAASSAHGAGSVAAPPGGR